MLAFTARLKTQLLCNNKVFRHNFKIGFRLNVTMPANAPPQRHSWTLPTDDVASGDLTFSLHVLQRNDVSLTLVEPSSTTSVTVLEVGASEDMTVSLSTPGIDADAYAFVASLDPARRPKRVVVDPDTDQERRSSGSSFLTMSVTVDGDVPALEPSAFDSLRPPLQTERV